MGSLKVGTLLLKKYRIDRASLEGHDVSLYEATDVVHARHVRVKLFRSKARFERDARAPSVLDLGHAAGAPYVVVGDPGDAPLAHAKPPPLPARAPTPAAADDDASSISIVEAEVEQAPIAGANDEPTLDLALLASLRPGGGWLVWTVLAAAAVLVVGAALVLR